MKSEQLKLMSPDEINLMPKIILDSHSSEELKAVPVEVKENGAMVDNNGVVVETKEDVQ